MISCGSSGYEFDSNAFDEQLQLIDGSKILIKNSASINDLTINDVFIAIDQSSFPLLLPTKDGWNRVNCQTTNHKISLYFKYSSLIDEYEFPSSTITCEDSFKSLNSPLHSFSVRCPRYCVSCSLELSRTTYFTSFLPSSKVLPLLWVSFHTQ